MAKYSEEQKEILYMAKCEDLPLRKLVNPQFTVNELLAVLDGLRDGLDVTLYADNKYNYLQMITIMEGLSEGLDVTSILDHTITWKEMEVLLDFIREGFDPKTYIEEHLTSNQLIGLLKILESAKPDSLLKIAKTFNYDIAIVNNVSGFDFGDSLDSDEEDLLELSPFGLNREFHTDQLALIEKSVIFGNSIVNYAFPEMKLDILTEIANAVKKGLDVRQFALPVYTLEQIRFIEDAMLSGKDVTYILKPDLSLEDMEIRLNWGE